MLTAQGYPQDVVDAVLSASFDDALDALARVKALSDLKGQEDFRAAGRCVQAGGEYH